MHVFIMSIFDINVIIIYIVHNIIIHVYTKYKWTFILWGLKFIVIIAAEQIWQHTTAHLMHWKGFKRYISVLFFSLFLKKIFLIFNRKENGKMWQWIFSCILDHSNEWAGQVERVNVFSQLSDVSDWKYNWLVLNHYLICFLVKIFDQENWMKKLGFVVAINTNFACQLQTR